MTLAIKVVYLKEHTVNPSVMTAPGMLQANQGSHGQETRGNQDLSPRNDHRFNNRLAIIIKTKF